MYIHIYIDMLVARSSDVPACGRPSILPSAPFRALSRPSFVAHVVFQWSAQKVNRTVQQVNMTSQKVDRTTPKVNRTSQKVDSATPQMCVCACVSSSSLSILLWRRGEVPCKCNLNDDH